MKTALTVRHLRNEPSIQKHFNSHSEKLKTYLGHFDDSSLYLQGSLDKNPHKEEYYASLRFYMPHLSLFAHKTAEDVLGVINLAFDSIIEQIKKHHRKLLQKRKHRNKLQEDIELLDNI